MNDTPYTTDTSAEASAVQLEGLRRLTPPQRLCKALALSSQIRKLAFDAIRRRYPELDEDQVQLRFVALAYGKQLADDLARWKGERQA